MEEEEDEAGDHDHVEDSVWCFPIFPLVSPTNLVAH